MKRFMMILLLIVSAAGAEQVGVKVDKVDAHEDTTISISRGKASKKKYVTSAGELDIQGNKDVVAKAAETNWQDACREWKSDFRKDNKDNKIVLISCGKPVCTKEGVETTCVSQAKYEVKTLSEE